VARSKVKTALRSLQTQFLAALSDPASREIEKWIRPSQRLSIYRGNRQGRLYKTLKTTFEVCFALVGEDFFRGLSRAYSVDYPDEPLSDLNQVGKHFSVFLSTFPPAQDLVYLSDVARLEWACHIAWHALCCDEQIDLMQLDCTRRLGLLPGSAVLSSVYPIFHIWAANQPGCMDSVHLEEGGCWLFVYKDQKNEVKIAPLTRKEFTILTYFEKGFSLMEIAEKMPEDFSALFGQMINRRWLVDFS